MSGSVIWFLMIAGGVGNGAFVSVATFPTQLSCEAAGEELMRWTMHVGRRNWQCVQIPTGKAME